MSRSCRLKAFDLGFIHTNNNQDVFQTRRNGLIMKKALAIIIIAASAMAFADNHSSGAKAEHKAKAEEHKAAIATACSADAATAGCADKELGGGLLKCLHSYKKANKGFEISEGCKTATKAMHNARKDWKAKKAAAKAEQTEEKADK